MAGRRPGRCVLRPGPSRSSPTARVRHVVPGSGGGTGTERDPFRGLAAAEQGQAKTHTELITKLPVKYAIRTSGEPEMVSVAYEMAATR